MCSLELPADLRSGVYALRLRAGGFEDHVPFFVRARPSHEGDVALVLPTASYMAYANEHLAAGAPMGQAIVGHTPALHAMDLLLMEHPELGSSMYDLHTDGSGVAFSSRRRPILNMRPRHRFSFMGTWQFPSDLYLVDWLERFGYRYDVLTDEDLHRDGARALAPYRAVITGSHPEYTSERMLDAYEAYVTGGGNVMYMGGNGFYWVITYSAEKPWVMEVRRGEAGVRAWQAAPGETTHSTTGEKGGLWRNRGRAPQKLFGTGFAWRATRAPTTTSACPTRTIPPWLGSSTVSNTKNGSATSAWSAAARPDRRSTARTSRSGRRRMPISSPRPTTKMIPTR